MTLQNSPPEIAFSMAIDDLYEEAKNFIDGSPIATEGQAEAIATIFDQLKALRRDGDAQRKAEKKPHDDAGKAVQAKWVPILDKADIAIKAIEKPLSAYRAAVLAEQHRIAEQARIEAENARLAALQAKDDDSLEGLEQLETLRSIADAAEKQARRAAPKGPTGLRTYWEGEVTNYSQALAWIRANEPERLKMAIDAMVKEAVNSGVRRMDGVVITERKKAA